MLHVLPGAFVSYPVVGQSVGQTVDPHLFAQIHNKDPRNLRANSDK